MQHDYTEYTTCGLTQLTSHPVNSCLLFPTTLWLASSPPDYSLFPVNVLIQHMQHRTLHTLSILTLVLHSCESLCTAVKYLNGLCTTTLPLHAHYTNNTTEALSWYTSATSQQMQRPLKVPAAFSIFKAFLQQMRTHTKKTVLCAPSSPCWPTHTTQPYSHHCPAKCTPIHLHCLNIMGRLWHRNTILQNILTILPSVPPMKIIARNKSYKEGEWMEFVRDRELVVKRQVLGTHQEQRANAKGKGEGMTQLQEYYGWCNKTE